MITKLRKFGTDAEFEAVDHRETECAFCEAARQRGIQFRDDHREQDEAVVFLENEAGQVHRISARRIGGVVVLCGENVSTAQARAEIAGTTCPFCGAELVAAPWVDGRICVDCSYGRK